MEYAPSPEETSSTPKVLTREQAVQAAAILFEINTRRTELLDMLARAGVPNDESHVEVIEAAVEEWYGFVHAAIVYGLMNQAPNAVMAEYLRTTRQLLQQVAGYDEQRIERFIDETFSGYIRLMAQNRQKESPVLFYKRVLGTDTITELPAERVAFLSGMMAITMCTVLDKMNSYIFEAE